MNQTNGIVTPSGTIISNAEVERILGLGKRMKEEVAAAADKEAEDLVTTLNPSPNRKRRSVTPVMATTRSVKPNKRLRVSSALIDFEDEDIAPILLNKAMAKSSDVVPASVLQATNKDLTGVSLSLTEVCATLSHQIYEATSMESFYLSDSSHQAELLYFYVEK
jgi:HEAT repeat protein